MTIYYGTGGVAFPRNAGFTTGKAMRTVNFKETAPGTGIINDQYILAGPVSLDSRIARIYSQRLPALTSVTGANLGFYYKKPDGTFAVVKAAGGNELWSGVNLATAVTTYLDVLTNKNASLDNTKNIRSLLSIGPDQEPAGGVFLVLTLPQANTAGGVMDMDILIEEPTAF
jgi:hypothetical protein